MNLNLATILAAVALAAPAMANPVRPDAVRGELESLSQYSIYDFIEYRVQGTTVILTGQVHQPALKMQAEMAVRRLSGVRNVENWIEVLPSSKEDKFIRMEVAKAIYGNGSAARGIHIVVKNGEVTLHGRAASDEQRRAVKAAAGVKAVSMVRNALRGGKGF